MIQDSPPAKNKNPTPPHPAPASNTHLACPQTSAPAACPVSVSRPLRVHALPSARPAASALCRGSGVPRESDRAHRAQDFRNKKIKDRETHPSHTETHSPRPGHTPHPRAPPFTEPPRALSGARFSAACPPDTIRPHPITRRRRRAHAVQPRAHRLQSRSARARAAAARSVAARRAPDAVPHSSRARGSLCGGAGSVCAGVARWGAAGLTP